MDSPLVSICIPAYNAAQYIQQTLNSIFQQSYKKIEIIVVDDGSSDGTLRILKKNQKENLTIITQENKGQCAAANRAYGLSKGEFIKFMDADDLLSASFIENQVLALTNTSHAIASASWGRFYNNDLNTFKLSREDVWKDMNSLEWLKTSLASGNNMMQCGLWLIPRKTLLLSGLWDERLSLINDFEFFIRVLLKSNQIKFVENAILYYRSGTFNSLSKQKTEKAFNSAYLATSLGLDYLLAEENSYQTRRIIADTYQMLSFELYPTQLKLYHLTVNKVKRYGGSNLSYQSGAKTKLLVNLIGWKLTKKLKIYLNELEIFN